MTTTRRKTQGRVYPEGTVQRFRESMGLPTPRVRQSTAPQTTLALKVPKQRGPASTGSVANVIAELTWSTATQAELVDAVVCQLAGWKVERTLGGLLVEGDIAVIVRVGESADAACRHLVAVARIEDVRGLVLVVTKPGRGKPVTELNGKDVRVVVLKGDVQS
jgi:hypothetical protein